MTTKPVDTDTQTPEQLRAEPTAEPPTPSHHLLYAAAGAVLAAKDRLQECHRYHVQNCHDCREFNCGDSQLVSNLRMAINACQPGRAAEQRRVREELDLYRGGATLLHLAWCWRVHQLRCISSNLASALSADRATLAKYHSALVDAGFCYECDGQGTFTDVACIEGMAQELRRYQEHECDSSTCPCYVPPPEPEDPNAGCYNTDVGPPTGEYRELQGPHPKPASEPAYDECEHGYHRDDCGTCTGSVVVTDKPRQCGTCEHWRQFPDYTTIGSCLKHIKEREHGWCCDDHRPRKPSAAAGKGIATVPRAAVGSAVLSPPADDDVAAAGVEAIRTRDTACVISHPFGDSVNPSQSCHDRRHLLAALDTEREQHAKAEAEVKRLRARLRLTCQILVACVGAGGPTNAEDAAKKTVARAKQLVNERNAAIAAQRKAEGETERWKGLLRHESRKLSASKKESERLRAERAQPAAERDSVVLEAGATYRVSFVHEDDGEPHDFLLASEDDGDIDVGIDPSALIEYVRSLQQPAAVALPECVERWRAAPTLQLVRTKDHSSVNVAMDCLEWLATAPAATIAAAVKGNDHE